MQGICLNIGRQVKVCGLLAACYGATGGRQYCVGVCMCCCRHHPDMGSMAEVVSAAGSNVCWRARSTCVGYSLVSLWCSLTAAHAKVQAPC